MEPEVIGLLITLAVAHTIAKLNPRKNGKFNFGLLFVMIFASAIVIMPATRIAHQSIFGSPAEIAKRKAEECIRTYAIPAGYSDASKYGVGLCREVAGITRATPERIAFAKCILPMLPSAHSRVALQLATRQCTSPSESVPKPVAAQVAPAGLKPYSGDLIPVSPVPAPDPAAAAQSEWDAAVAAWVNANPEFANSSDNMAVMQQVLDEIDPGTGDIATLLLTAQKIAVGRINANATAVASDEVFTCRSPSGEVSIQHRPCDAGFVQVSRQTVARP